MSVEVEFDLEQLVESMGGDHELLAEIASMFIEQSRGLEASMQQAVDVGDGPALRAAAHRLVGSTGVFHQGAVLVALQRIEALAVDGALLEASVELQRARLGLARLRELLAPATVLP